MRMGSEEGLIMRNFIVSPNIVRLVKSRILRWAGVVARMEEGSTFLKILTGKSTGKRILGKAKFRWEDNNRMGSQI